MDKILLTLSIICGQLIKLPIGTHGGLTLLDAAVIILCFFGLLRIRVKLSKPPLWIKASFGFILIALLSLILTPLSLTQIEYFTSISYTIRFSLYILFGWLVYSGALPNLKKNIKNILLTSGVVLAALGLLQFIFLPDLSFLEKFGWDPHYFRAASTFLDPNFLGSFLMLTLLLVKNKYFFTLVFIALMLTFSRGAYLAFLTSFLSLSFLNRSLPLGIVTIILFLGLILGFSTYERLVAQPRNIDRAQSAQFRLETWQQGFKLFQMHPVLGVGFNTYRYALKQYNLGDDEFLKSHGASTNDSSFIYVAATTGIIGFVSYVFFLGVIFVAGVKLNYILSAGLVGLLAQSFFANTLFYPPLILWVILAATYKEDKTSS